MKFLRILSATAIVNLLAVVVISGFSGGTNQTGSIAANEIVMTPMPTPTPIIIIKKVVTKVYRTAAPVLSASTATNTQTTNTTQAGGGTTSAPNPQPTAAPAPAANKCIIVIDGGNYDVTAFRFTHSGGNVFSCGSDMSATFWGRHGQREFSIMQQYRI